MKNLALSLFVVFTTLTSQLCSAHDATSHPHHNMVLFGDTGLFASHIVYKEPHNYQVILKLGLNPEVQAKVLAEMAAHTDEQFIFLLDPMDISQITTKPAIAGQIFRTTSSDKKTILFEQVALQPNDYTVIYFDEVPLSLHAGENMIK